MTVHPRTGLVAAAWLALLLIGLDTAGWIRWRAAARALRVNPERGASILLSDPTVVLPSFSHRARRLVVRDLGPVPTETVVECLLRVGAHQARWMPLDPSGWTHLAHASLLGDRAPEALRALTAAVERDPTSPSLRRLRALVLLYLGVMDDALVDLSISVALAPGLRVPEVELPPEDERRVRLRGLSLRPQFYPRRQIEAALALARELRSDDDVAAASEVLAGHADHPEVAIENARWDLEDGDAATASVRLESVVERTAYPRRIRARAWSLLAVARDESGDPDGALEAARAALELDSRSPMPFVTLASLAQRRGDHETALAHLRRAWGMAPTDVPLLSRIAAVAYRAGKPADALLALERAVELDPDEPHHVVSLVTIQLETGRYTEAALTLSRAADRFPTDGELLRLAERLRRDVGIR